MGCVTDERDQEPLHRTNSTNTGLRSNSGIARNSYRQASFQGVNNQTSIRSRFHLRRSDGAQIERARTRTLRMTLIIVLAFIWCWTPYVFIVLLYQIDHEFAHTLDRRLQDTLFMFAVSNSCVNPLVYGSYTMNFRNFLRRFFRRCPSPELVRQASVRANLPSTATHVSCLDAAAGNGNGKCPDQNSSLLSKSDKDKEFNFLHCDKKPSLKNCITGGCTPDVIASNNITCYRSEKS